MSKRIVLCFDGTWNSSDMEGGGTNVVRFYRSILGKDTSNIQSDDSLPDPQTPTIKWYDSGVGTAWNERLRGGVLGFGLSRNIREGYKVLIDNYEEGDEIYLFGFSRGAYTARSLAGLIRNIGIIKREHAPESDVDNNPVIVQGYNLYKLRDESADTENAQNFREQYSLEGSWNNVIIKFLGVWDTVGALGIPGPFLEELDETYAFHDTRLSRIVENAYHAVAIDEHRKDFEAALWNSKPREYQKIEQVWFVGAHGDVGGTRLAFSNIGLRWIQDKAQLDGKGVEIDPNQIPDIGQRYLTEKVSDSYGDFLFGLYSFVRRLFGSGRYYRPVKQQENGNESIHSTALEKMRQDPKYKPKNRGLQ